MKNLVPIKQKEIRGLPRLRDRFILAYPLFSIKDGVLRGYWENEIVNMLKKKQNRNKDVFKDHPITELNLN